MKVLLLLLSGLWWQSAFAALTPWQQIKRPIDAPTQAIGSFNNGCLIGAQPLSLDSSWHQVLRPARLRYFGHPYLIQYLNELIDKVKLNNLGILLIGDLSMPAGGLFVDGHRSHQNGLDVDIWLQLPRRLWSSKQIQSPKAIDLVSKNGKSILSALWKPQYVTLIKLAAEDQRVNRIFVHPAIKKQLCQVISNDQPWLRKIRPWFGHRSHIHVRLTCPPQSENCIDQTLPPKGSGCGAELDSWLADSVSLPSAKPGPRETPVMPALCQQLLNKVDLKEH